MAQDLIDSDFANTSDHSLLNLNDMPIEIKVLILSFVDNNTLSKKCRFVCKQWNVLIKTYVWKLKAERKHRGVFEDLKLTKRLPWSVYHSIARKNAFGKNLLGNNCGQSGFKHWQVMKSGRYGSSIDGDKWKVEQPPIGVPEEDPEKHKICFVTSYLKCVKKQLIDLCKEGIHSDILDKFQPDIFISEYFAPRWDCCSCYEIEVKLLNEKKKVLKKFDFQQEMRPVTHGWKEINHTFKEYGPGVRYILFTHAGKDLQFWAGHYGSKMTDARVEIPFYALRQLQISNDDDFEY